MNIEQELLAEHSKQQAVKIAAYACASKRNFKELMKCFVSPEYRVAQRAAMSVSAAVRKAPAMIQPYLKDLVAQLQRKDVHNAVIRNSIRILEDIEIPEEMDGEMMNVCFQFIETPTTPIAIKAVSLTILHNLSKKYPEILPELKLIIQEKWDTETAAFKSRGRKILKSI